MLSYFAVIRPLLAAGFFLVAHLLQLLPLLRRENGVYLIAELLSRLRIRRAASRVRLLELRDQGLDPILLIVAEV